MIDTQAIEAGIEALKANRAPRVTPADIEAAIVREQYQSLEDTTITICLLTLRNGTKVLGYNYGAIDPAQQDWDVGQAESRKMAVDKVWELEGYLLREKLAANSDVPPVRLDAAH